MNQPSRMCDAEAFRTLHRLCARLTRKMPYTLYLAVWHTQSIYPEKAEQQLSRALTHGEVFCPMQPGVWYILLFADSQQQAESYTAALTQSPGNTLRLQRVTQRLTQDPSFDE